MSTVTGFTAARMLEIENATVVDGEVVGDNLILETRDGTTINAGNVRGPQGDPGEDGADAAPGSVTVVGNTTPIRTADGRVKGADPTAVEDLVTKSYSDANLATAQAYADSDRSGLKRVRMATTGNVTLSGLQTIDGVVGAAGDRVLVKAQTTASQNGVYLMASGSWTRATDADTAAEVAGVLVAVKDGTTLGGTRWATSFKATNTLGTTAMSWYRIMDQQMPQVITVSGTTDANGFLTVTHGLPFTPSAVFGSNGNPSSTFAVLWGVDTLGATTFRARFMHSSGGPLVSASVGTYRCLCYV